MGCIGVAQPFAIQERVKNEKARHSNIQCVARLSNHVVALTITSRTRVRVWIINVTGSEATQSARLAPGVGQLTQNGYSVCN